MIFTSAIDGIGSGSIVASKSSAEALRADAKDADGREIHQPVKHEVRHHAPVQGRNEGHEHAAGRAQRDHPLAAPAAVNVV